MSASRDRDACRFCHHACDEHNPMEGCPYCSCVATRGECMPQSRADALQPVRPPGSHSSHHALFGVPSQVVRDRHETPIIVGRFRDDDADTGWTYYEVEPIEPGEIPADRLAFWQLQSVRDRGGATELLIATRRTTTVYDTTGWTSDRIASIVPARP